MSNTGVILIAALCIFFGLELNKQKVRMDYLEREVTVCQGTN